MNDKLREILLERRIAQKELAEAAGVSESFISHVINGKKMPSVLVLKRVADYLHVTVDELID